MRLTDIVITEVKTNKRCKNRLALEMDKDSTRITDWISVNKEDGPLTTAKALTIISQETGIPKSKLLIE